MDSDCPSIVGGARAEVGTWTLEDTVAEGFAVAEGPEEVSVVFTVTMTTMRMMIIDPVVATLVVVLFPEPPVFDIRLPVPVGANATPYEFLEFHYRICTGTSMRRPSA